MSTFAQLVARNGNVGLAYTLTVYADLDDPPIALYSTHGIPGSTAWDPRLLMPGRVQRGLVPDFAIAASTVQVQLDNTDGGADWLVDQATLESQVLRASFDLALVVYALEDPSDIQSFQLGHFVLLDRPVGDAGRVTISLADDSMGRAAELARAPSLLDWVEDPDTDSDDCPLVNEDDVVLGRGLNIRNAPLLDVPSISSPIRLAFGHQPIKGMRCLEAAQLQPNATTTVFSGQGGGVIFNNSDGTTSQLNGTGYTTTAANLFKRVLMVCATTNSAIDAHTNTTLALGFESVYEEGKVQLVNVPKSTTLGTFPGDIWEGKKSEPLMKDGKEWYLVYVVIDYQKLQGWWNATQNAGSTSWPCPSWAESTWYVYVPLFSSHTFTAPSSGTLRPVTPAQIAVDLLAQYSRGLDVGAGDIDVSSFSLLSNRQQALPAWGIVADERNLGPYAGEVFALPTARVEAIGGQMRRVLSELCRSAQFDITTKWDGTIFAIPQTAYIDVGTPAAVIAALPELEETLIVEDSWNERTPSEGERWAPHNRLLVQNRAGQTFGPFDSGNFFHGGFDVDNWGVVLPYTLISKWVDYPEVADKLFAATGFEAKARPVVTVRYPLAALALELGSYVRVSWTRGGNIAARYSDAVFKVEGMHLLPGRAEVQLELVWYGDLATVLPYILDDEDYTAVTDSATFEGGGEQALVTDSIDIVSFGKGADLPAAGVLPGDVLVLKDATQAANVFSRFRALRIIGVTTVELTVEDDDLDFDAPGPLGAMVATWEIRRGFPTYPDTGSDPTHYPDGSTFYGKVTDEDGEFSDTTAGNQLLSG